MPVLQFVMAVNCINHMAFNDLKTLFESSHFSLPYIETEDKRSFLHHYQHRMRHFLAELNTLPEKATDTCNKDNLIADVTYITSALVEVLALYLNGFPSKAYSKFKGLIELPILAARLTGWRTVSRDSGTPLFRTKQEFNYKEDINKPIHNGFVNHIDPIELFHVPFEKRKAIGTNRFSIPGFPCIYLSDTLYTSWSEALGDKNSLFHAACFRNHRPVYLADMVPLNVVTPPTASDDYLAMLYGYNDVTDVFIDYIFMYPLITACHSKITYKSQYPGEVKFRSEYIIPQLLLQWYRDNQIIVDGIRYLSCTAEARFGAKKFGKFNYVIPAIEMKEEGYCSALLYNYSATRVYSYLKTTDDPEFEMLEMITRELDREPVVPLIKA